MSLEKVGEDSGLEEADDMDGVAVKTEIKRTILFLFNKSTLNVK